LHAIFVTAPAPAPAPIRAGTALSFLALMAGAVAIGFAPIFVRLSAVGPVSTAFWRVAIALPILLAAWTDERRRLARAAHAAAGGKKNGSVPPQRLPLPAGIARTILIAGGCFAADLTVWHWSIHFTSVANSTLLTNFAPVYVTLFGWAVLGERVSRGFLLAMAVALGGTILLVGSDFQLQQRALLGDLLACITAIFYAGYLLAVKSLRARLSTLSIVSRSGLVTAAALLPLALISDSAFVPGTARAWLVVIALAVISHVGGQSLIAFGLARVPAPAASVSLLVQPLTATVAAAWLLGERVTPIQMGGMGLVLAGVLASQLLAARNPASAGGDGSATKRPRWS
jgi:drug/metabolite transporter (DMT)-like permease